MTHALRLTKQMLVKVCRELEAPDEERQPGKAEWEAMDPDSRGDMTAEWMWNALRRESGEYTEAEQNAERERLIAESKLRDDQLVSDALATESGAIGRNLDVTDQQVEEQTISTTDVGKVDETLSSTAKVADALRSKKQR